METSTIISLVIFFLLIELTTVFVGSEFALVKVRSTHIEQLVDEGKKRKK
ncbi:MAG: CNNM domain-containing protein, partial [Staphylococcus epidermidis]|nr:CNNM domain-containing protein [Staphylococcus epidermidis]